MATKDCYELMREYADYQEKMVGHYRKLCEDLIARRETFNREVILMAFPEKWAKQ